MACNIDNDDNNIKFSTCLSDIDEWLEHANKFCRSSNHLTGLSRDLMSIWLLLSSSVFRFMLHDLELILS